VLRPGETFAGYRIEGLIGEGGMGAVYLARHPRLPRQDALKVLHPALSREPAYVVRFEREADAAARLSHPAVVAVYDRGMHDGQLWISMQYVRGGDAAMDLRAHGAMSLPRVVHIIGQVADALDHAHAHGLVHRDVKPDNILLAPRDTGPGERVMLTDFGIASASGNAQLTGTGSFVATMAYAPIEQLEGRGVDARTDVYALGAVLYELLTDERPFEGLGVEALYAAKVRGDVPDLAARRRDVPEPVAGVVRRAMATDPGLRFATCGELAATLRRAAAPPPPPPPPRGTATVTGPTPTPAPTPAQAPAWEREHRPPRRRRGLLVGLGALVVLLLAGGVTTALLLTGGTDPPGGLRLETADGEVRLHWSAVRGADTYELSRDGAHLADTAETGYVDADVEGGRSYRYEVRAVDGDSRSGPASFPAVTASLAPPRVSAGVDGLSVVLSWQAVPGAEHYEVASGGQDLASVPGTTWTHEGAGAGRHAYVVTAVDEDGGGRSSGRVAADVEPWGTMQPIATRLPTLFPPTPTDPLPEPVDRHTCAPSAPDNGAVERVVCTFDNGIQATVDRWATAQDVTEDLQRFNFAAITTWFCTEGDTEGQFVEAVLDTGSPFELLTFVDEEVALFDVYVAWDSARTVEDLRTTFFASGIFCP
jgi:tRNA A-37 threonylcarbamoyl transferase component Bud32